jgi:hypothetical protein
MSIWSILRLFGTVCGHLVHFFHFGMLDQENLATLEQMHV